MRARIETWFGPVVDANGVRVPWRASRSAFALAVVALMFTAATAVLAVLMAIGVFAAPLWGATIIASYGFAIAAHRKLRGLSHLKVSEPPVRGPQEG